MDNINQTLEAIKNKNSNERFCDLEFFNKIFQSVAGENYQINSDNEKIIKTLKMYFSGLENFNQFGCISNSASLNKGIYLWGENGVGKSEFFNIIHKIGSKIKPGCKSPTRLKFPKINSKLFSENYMKEIRKKPENTNFELSRFYKGNLYIGDFGKEDLVFGKKELIGDLIYIRNRYKGFSFITSNLSPLEVAIRYGTALVDRINQDCNIIKWDGESFRSNFK
jgi:DNA replication protein DnaC